MSDQAKKKRAAAEAMKTTIAGLRSTTQEIRKLLHTFGEKLSPEQKSGFGKMLDDKETEINDLSGQQVTLLDDAVSDEVFEAQQEALEARSEQAKKDLETQTDTIKSIFEQQRKDIASAGALSPAAAVVPGQDQPLLKRIRQRRGSESGSADKTQLQDGPQIEPVRSKSPRP